jgi:hypothetical protein
MADDLKVPVAKIAQLSMSTLDAAKALSTVQLDAQDALVVPHSVFGNLRPEVATEHEAVVEAADLVMEDFVSACEADVDNLQRVAFYFKQLQDNQSNRVQNGLGQQVPLPRPRPRPPQPPQ